MARHFREPVFPAEREFARDEHGFIEFDPETGMARTVAVFEEDGLELGDDVELQRRSYAAGGIEKTAPEMAYLTRDNGMTLPETYAGFTKAADAEARGDLLDIPEPPGSDAIPL